jgi:hypothetical protein
MELNRREEELLKVLETVLLMQLLTESIEALPKETVRFKIRHHCNSLVDLMSPIIEKHFDNMFFTDEKTTSSIAYEIDKLIRILARNGLDQRVFLSQAVEAYELDKNRAEKEIHKILTEGI